MLECCFFGHQKKWEKRDCNGSKGGVPGGVFRGGGWEIDGVRSIWSCKYNAFRYRLFLCLGACTGTPVTPPFILKHECTFDINTVGVRIP